MCINSRKQDLLWYVALGELSKPYIAATIHCREDVRWLQTCGWDAILYTQADGEFKTPECVKEVAVCRNRPIVFRFFFELLLVLRLLVARRKPAFVMFRGTGTYLIALALRLMGIPYGVEFCGPPSSFVRARTWHDWGYPLTREQLRHARVIIALTQELADLAAKIASPRAVIAVTGVGVNCRDYRIASESGSPHHDGPVLAFLGTIYADRGLGRTLDAVAELHRRGVRARLVVVGDGSDRMRAEQRAADLGLADAVEFKGWVAPENVPEALAECDLLVAMYEHALHLTLGGINPMKVWTSLAVGKPVLLHNPGKYDTYQDVPGIFSCPQTAPTDIADRVVEVWSSCGRDELAAAGMAGRRYVAENVTWLAHVRVIDQSIRQALQSA